MKKRPTRPALGQTVERFAQRQKLFLGRLGLNVSSYIADGLEFLGIRLRNFALNLILKLFFKSHNQLDCVERIGPEVIKK